MSHVRGVDVSNEDIDGLVFGVNPGAIQSVKFRGDLIRCFSIKR